MKPSNPFAIVKECKGAALAILVLLAANRRMGGGAITQEWLERHSGYTDKPVSQALAYLAETGRIVRTSAGWMLAEEGELSLPGLAHAEEKFSGNPAEGPQESQPGPETSRELSDSPTTPPAIDPLQETIPIAGEGKGVGIIPTPTTLEHIEANLATFKKWGVGRNEKTILLAARPEVTPQQIEAIAQRLISEKRFSTGLLITAVQSGDQPVLNPRGTPPGERDPKRYADWER